MDEAYEDLTLEDVIVAYEHALETAKRRDHGPWKVFWMQRAESFRQIKEELEQD